MGGLHRPILQQDGGSIAPRDRVLIGSDQILKLGKTRDIVLLGLQL
jgi:hypothetical protein